MVGRWKPRHILRIPPVHIHIGPTHVSRLADHYRNTIVHDLLYLHYSYSHTTSIPHPPQPDVFHAYQPTRKPPPLKANRPLLPSTAPNSVEKVTRLVRIIF